MPFDRLKSLHITFSAENSIFRGDDEKLFPRFLSRIHSLEDLRIFFPSSSTFAVPERLSSVTLPNLKILALIFTNFDGDREGGVMKSFLQRHPTLEKVCFRTPGQLSMVQVTHEAVPRLRALCVDDVADYYAQTDGALLIADRKFPKSILHVRLLLWNSLDRSSFLSVIIDIGVNLRCLEFFWDRADFRHSISQFRRILTAQALPNLREFGLITHSHFNPWREWLDQHDLVRT